MGTRWKRLAAALVCIGVVGCGSSTPTAEVPDTSTTPETRPPDTRYEVTATVLDDGDGPELCAGGVLTSLPPQCGGPALPGWDWDAVSGFEEMGGVRWGGFHLVGTWDGTNFTLTEPPTPTPSSLPGGDGAGEDEPDLTPPCPEPDGGWPTASTTFEQWQTFLAAAQEPGDLAAFWVYRRGPGNDPGRDVSVVAYTGEVEAHRAALEEIWPGPLCVVQFERSLDDLRSIQMELSDQATTDSLGLYAFATAVDQRRQTVVLDVLVDEPQAQAELDARYGAGLVVLRPAFTPIP